jgi:hypothetical protein
VAKKLSARLVLRRREEPQRGVQPLADRAHRPALLGTEFTALLADHDITQSLPRLA